MKTLVACDFMYEKPNIFKCIFGHLIGYNYQYNKRNGCWCLKRLVKGEVIGEDFIPYLFQSVQYRIHWPYGVK